MEAATIYSADVEIEWGWVALPHYCVYCIKDSGGGNGVAGSSSSSCSGAATVEVVVMSVVTTAVEVKQR